MQAKKRAGPIARSRLLWALLKERKIPGFPESWDGWDLSGLYQYQVDAELSIKVQDYRKGTKTVPPKELVESMEKHFRLRHRMTELVVAGKEHVKETQADRKDKTYLLLDSSESSESAYRYYGASPSFNPTLFEKRYPEISK